MLVLGALALGAGRPTVDRTVGRMLAACEAQQPMQLAPRARAVLLQQQQQQEGSKRWGPAPPVVGCSCCREGRVVLLAVASTVWCVSQRAPAATG